MSFQNPYRALLAEDQARDHFESHVLETLPMHIAAREERAMAKNMTRSEYEEELFQEWYALKQARGFAQFTSDWIDSDESED